MVSIVNLIGLGAVVIVGILIFTQFQRLGGFLSGLQFPSFPDIGIPDIPRPFVGPERMDVPLGGTGQIIDIVPDVTGGRAERLEGVIGPTEPFDVEGFFSKFRDLFPTGFETPEVVPELGRVDPRREVEAPIISTSLMEFATAIVPETQAGFQERSMAFAETFPNIAFSTSLTPDITFGRQLSRESENFEDVLASEARRSEAIFVNLFGNVQNPNF